MIMNDQLSGSVDKETYQFSLLFLILNKCSLNLDLSLSTYGSSLAKTSETILETAKL